MATRIFSKSFTLLFENGLFSSDEKSDREELRLYYTDFFEEKYFAKTEVINTKTIEVLDEKYTVYVIQVKLPFAEYLIEKRYTQFLELYKKIERNYKRIGVGKLPFPSRSLFGSFTEETIQHRKSLLNTFLTFLSDEYKQEQAVEFLEFLEIKKRIEMMIRLPAVETSSIKPENAKMTTDVEQVTYYLSLFNKNARDLCGSFREFETYFFESKPKLSKQAVKKLLYGDDEYQGLIHLCGKCDSHTDSHLTCGAGMNLLIRLLDYEYNRDAELFNHVFASTSLRDMMYLYFDRHIQAKRVKSCKIAAIKLLSTFIKYNPNIAINQILSEDGAIQEFEVWKTSQQTTSIKAESYFKF